MIFASILDQWSPTSRAIAQQRSLAQARYLDPYATVGI